jgi:hypothetical protein
MWSQQAQAETMELAAFLFSPYSGNVALASFVGGIGTVKQHRRSYRLLLVENYNGFSLVVNLRCFHDGFSHNKGTFE